MNVNTNTLQEHETFRYWPPYCSTNNRTEATAASIRTTMPETLETPPKPITTTATWIGSGENKSNEFIAMAKLVHIKPGKGNSSYQEWKELGKVAGTRESSVDTKEPKLTCNSAEEQQAMRKKKIDLAIKKRRFKWKTTISNAEQGKNVFLDA